MVARRRSSRIEAFGRRGRTGLIGRGAQYADFSAGRRVVKVLSSLRNYGYELRGDLSRGPARGFVQRRCRVRLGLAVILRAFFLGGAQLCVPGPDGSEERHFVVCDVMILMPPIGIEHVFISPRAVGRECRIPLACALRQAQGCADGRLWYHAGPWARLQNGLVEAACIIAYSIDGRIVLVRGSLL